MGDGCANFTSIFVWTCVVNLDSCFLILFTCLSYIHQKEVYSINVHDFACVIGFLNIGQLQTTACLKWATFIWIMFSTTVGGSFSEGGLIVFVGVGN